MTHFSHLRLALLSFAVLSLLAFAPHPAASDPQVYVVGSGGEFGTLDPATGVYTNIGALDEYAANGVSSGFAAPLSGLGFIDGTLYGLSYQDLGNTGGTDVFTVDPTSGAERLVGNASTVMDDQAIVDGNTFYAVNQGTSEFYGITINPSNNDITTNDITTLTDTSGNPFALDGLLGSNGSTLYAAESAGASDGNDELYSISTSGTTTDIGNTNYFSQTFLTDGVYFNNTLYGFSVAQNNQQLQTDAPNTYTLDTGSGGATPGNSYVLTGGSSTDYITADAVGPNTDVIPAPEPSGVVTFTLMSLGLFGLIVRRRIGHRG